MNHRPDIGERNIQLAEKRRNEVDPEMSQLPIEERLLREKQVQNFAREQAAKEKEEEEL